VRVADPKGFREANPIKGNRYRVVVAVLYKYGIVFVRFVGAHQDYDKIDAVTI